MARINETQMFAEVMSAVTACLKAQAENNDVAEFNVMNNALWFTHTKVRATLATGFAKSVKAMEQLQARGLTGLGYVGATGHFYVTAEGALVLHFMQQYSTNKVYVFGTKAMRDAVLIVGKEWGLSKERSSRNKGNNG